MAFAVTTEIHRLIGFKTITDENGNDVTSTTLAAAVEKGDSRVILETGVASWTALDNVYPSIVQAACFFGVDYIFPGYSDNQDQGTTMYQKALDICYSISRSSTQSLVIGVKAHRSFPLNQNANIYRSIPPTSTDTLSGGVNG